jgi:diguanylate cyclase (GGDEF)-like protein
MKMPDTPDNEEARLKALFSLDILDTDAEERFDRLTRLAKRMFNVPIALVCLVDRHRQWFKSCDGLNVRETPRDISFCGHAIFHDQLFVIEDASQDERFVDNPLVLGYPHIRFYAGRPLRFIDGSNLGTLCIIDTQPRAMDKEDLEALEDLAELAERELAAVQLATLDELTKISNRRGFIVLAQKALKVCIRHSMPASLIYLDLNGFKAINDQFGHGVGDSALVSFAKALENFFRDSDVFARIGGDEFVILLTNTSAEKAQELIERFRLVLGQINKQANAGFDLLFCEGIVACDFDNNCSIDALLDAADRLMYKKKGQI